MAAEAHEPPIGVLIVNLGSPDAPTPAAVRRYLREFLSDPLVVDAPRWLWWPVLYGIVLPLRPRRVARQYAQVWTDAGAPLVATTRQQAAALQECLGDRWIVRSAMRYGRPAIATELAALQTEGCRKIVVVPLFPQFARATVGSIEQQLRTLHGGALVPASTVVVPPYHATEGYLGAVAASIRRHREGVDADTHLVISFHGLPLSQVRRGDPYPEQCRQTAIDLAARLDLQPAQWSLAYQSRFGPQAWLQPYIIEHVTALAQDHRRLLVVCPGFAADCLETTEEIGARLAETFVAAGGEHLGLVPCLNSDAAFIGALEGLVHEAAPTAAAP